MFLKKLTYTTWCLLALAVILMFVTRNQVLKENEYDWTQQLEHEADKNTKIFEKQIQHLAHQLRGIISLFRASQTISRSSFKTYITPLLKNNNFVHSIQWIPKVNKNQRNTKESLARKQGFSSFQFTTFTKESGIIPAPIKNEYFPIYFMEPYLGNESILGFDISTQPNLLSSMNQARDSGQIVATNSEFWFHNNPKEMVMLFFAPFYKGDEIPKTIEARKDSFLGSILGVYKVKNLIKHIIEPYMIPGLFLSVFSDTDQQNHMYGTLKNSALIKKERLLNFSKIHWLLIWQANMQFQKGPNLLHNWVSVAVLVLIVCIAGVFQIITSRTRHIENEVQLRTDELNKLKNQLAEKNLSLQELIKMKNDLLGMASHDLRNPITSIQGYSGFLLKKGDSLDKETREEFLNIINTASSNIANLVNDLLSLSTIESGQLALNLNLGSLKRLIEERVHLYNHLAIEKKIKLKVRCNEFQEILFDEPRIGQVLDNLLTNAIKFSPIGGEIKITTNMDNVYAKVSITDEGAGLNNEDLENLFKPFKKLSSKPTGGEKGTGIGLAIAKKMIELHHGFLKFESLKNGGAKFIFGLPTKPPPSIKQE